jgi:lipoprotein-anchoring transpeptidase ErfK/SrfK
MELRPTHPAHLAVLVVLALALGAAVIGVIGDRGAGAATRAQLDQQLSSHDQLLAAVATPADMTTSSLPVARASTATTGSLAAAAPTAVLKRGGVACGAPHVTVSVPRSLPIRATPGGRVVGTMPARSTYLGQPTQAWVQARSADGAWGRVTLPWTHSVRASGWIPLAGLAASETRTMVVADLSERALRVYRGCDELFAAPIAVGRAGSPSPRGRFWVTDRVTVPATQRSSFGTYAFGLSTIQPRTPAGWTGGNQMAVHGTGAPGSIGSAASAGCLRVGEQTLARLRPLLRLGTPVVIQA